MLVVPPVCVGSPRRCTGPLPARDSCSYVITSFACVVSTLLTKAGVTTPSVWLIPSTPLVGERVCSKNLLNKQRGRHTGGFPVPWALVVVCAA